MPPPKLFELPGSVLMPDLPESQESVQPEKPEAEEAERAPWLESHEEERRDAVEAIQFLLEHNGIDLLPEALREHPEAQEISGRIFEKLVQIQQFAPEHIEHTRQMIVYISKFAEQFNNQESELGSMSEKELQLLKYLFLCHDIGKANTHDPVITQLVLGLYSYEGRVEAQGAQDGMAEVYEKMLTHPEKKAIFDGIRLKDPQIMAATLSNYFHRPDNNPNLQRIERMGQVWTICHSALGDELLRTNANHYGVLARRNPDEPEWQHLEKRERLAARFAALHHMFDGVLPSDFQNPEQVAERLGEYLEGISHDSEELMTGPADSVQKMTTWVALIVFIDKLQAGINRANKYQVSENFAERYQQALDFLESIIKRASHLENTPMQAEMMRVIKRLSSDTQIQDSVQQITADADQAKVEREEAKKKFELL